MSFFVYLFEHHLNEQQIIVSTSAKPRTYALSNINFLWKRVAELVSCVLIYAC